MINRNFTLIWISQALSDLASEMTSLALPLAILAATRSPVDASMVATAVAVAQLTAKLPGGLIADTANRKRLMILCDAGRGLIALFLAFALATGNLPTILAVAAAAVSATVSALFAPAETGLLRQAVPAELRRQAYARTIVRSNLAIAVGPPLGGLLLELGLPLPFIADATSYALSMIIVSRVVYRHTPRATGNGEATGSPNPPNALRQTGADLTRGFGWVFERKPLLVVVGFAAYLNLLGRAVELLAVIGSSDDGRHPVSAGIVLTAAGCGGIAGGVCTGAILRRVSPAALLSGVAAAWLILMPLTAMGIQAVTAVSIGLVVFSLPPMGSLVFVTAMAEAPAHLQGRVSAAVTLLATSIAWVGPALTGVLISSVGLQSAAVIFAAPMAAPLLAFRVSSKLRDSVNSIGSSTEGAEDQSPGADVAAESGAGAGPEAESGKTAAARPGR